MVVDTHTHTQNERDVKSRYLCLSCVLHNSSLTEPKNKYRRVAAYFHGKTEYYEYNHLKHFMVFLYLFCLLNAWELVGFGRPSTSTLLLKIWKANLNAPSLNVERIVK